jgi:hypothetical protein
MSVSPLVPLRQLAHPIGELSEIVTQLLERESEAEDPPDRVSGQIVGEPLPPHLGHYSVIGGKRPANGRDRGRRYTRRERAPDSLSGLGRIGWRGTPSAICPARLRSPAATG